MHALFLRKQKYMLCVWLHHCLHTAQYTTAQQNTARQQRRRRRRTTIWTAIQANTNVFPHYLQAAMCFCNMAKKARGNVHAVIRKEHPSQQWKALGQARSLLIRCTRPLGQRPESPYKCERLYVWMMLCVCVCVCIYVRICVCMYTRHGLTDHDVRC